MAILLVAALAASCGSEPPRGIWDGSFGSGSCSNGATGQFTCTPDPGSKPANCGEAEAGLELVTVGDFTGGKASNWYAYVDKSGADATIVSFDNSWETSTQPDPFPRCTDRSAPNAVHIQGGPFYGWGGGFGSSMRDYLPHTPDPKYDCFATPGNPLCEPSDYEFESNAVDLSQFEGVALWARRGPDSEGGIRINVGDVQTDDDISYLMYQADPTRPRNCERVRECACTNHKQCQPWAAAPIETQTPNLIAWRKALDAVSVQSYQIWSCANPGTYCEDPTADIIPGYFTASSPIASCNSCMQTTCEEPYPAYPNGLGGAMDIQFNGRPCTQFQSRTGIVTSYCFDPKLDPPPAEADQQCGDHWMRGIYLTNQWSLYLVPFTDLLQQGFGKRFGKIDTKHVTMLRLTWDGGYIDYWIGWIGFYRHKT